MGDIDRIAPTPPAVQAPIASQRAGDQPRRHPQRDEDRDPREDKIELTQGEEPLEAPLPPVEAEGEGGLDIAV